MTERRSDWLHLASSDLRPLRFRPCDARATLEVALGSGERLMDVVDASDMPVPFGCRAGTCGTCRSEIELGAELLEPPDDQERWQLERLVGDRLRLVCLARAKKW